MRHGHVYPFPTFLYTWTAVVKELISDLGKVGLFYLCHDPK